MDDFLLTDARSAELPALWRRRCERAGRACVVVTTAGPWASVELDLATTDRELGDAGLERVQTMLFGAAHRAAENGFDEGIKVAVGPTHAYVSRCETADALRLAEKLASEGAHAPSIDELIGEG